MRPRTLLIRPAPHEDLQEFVVEDRHPTHADYYTAGRKVAAEWLERDPAPTVTTRDPVPLDAPQQRQGLRLVLRHAIANGWEVRPGYSLGQTRAQRKGEYKIVHTWGLWGLGYGWRWCAMHEWSPDLKKDWAWSSTAIWRMDGAVVAPGLGTRFVHANVTELKQWLGLNGGTGAAWFKAVDARVAEQKAREKARSKGES